MVDISLYVFTQQGTLTPLVWSILKLFLSVLLKLHISVIFYYVEGHHRRSLTWTQRISAAIGIANGIQFLQTGIIPGVYSNELKITDILLDQNLVAKISSYNLPLLEVNIEQVSRKLYCIGLSIQFVENHLELDFSPLHLCRLVKEFLQVDPQVLTLLQGLKWKF